MIHGDDESSDPSSRRSENEETSLASGSGARALFTQNGIDSLPEGVPSQMPTRIVASTLAPSPTSMGSASTGKGIDGAEMSGSCEASQSLGIGYTLKNRFLLEEEIARGGMGVVYRARDLLKEQYRDRNPHVAVKVLSEQCKTHPDAFIALQREAGKAQKLAHPNIITVYDFDHDGDVVFMTMEYLEGRTLESYNEARQSLPKKVIFNIIEGMCRGLAYAHSKGIVHSDFKPANILVTSDGSVKILDFGIARVSAQHQKKTNEDTVFDAGHRLGALTPAYASCEMIEWGQPDPRDDIYALACVTYQLLSGRHPFNRMQATAARDSKLKPLPIKGLSKQQWKALQHGLAFDRNTRTSNVEQFMAELTEKGPLRNWFVIVAVALVLVVAGVAAYLPFTKSLPQAHEDVASPQNRIVLSADEREKVGRLLEAADIHFAVNRVTSPLGSNAFDAYQQVLEIDPNNPQARAGLRKIADYYEKLARASWKNGDVRQARELIDAGLKVQAQHPGLNDLLDEIEPRSIGAQIVQWFRNLVAR